MATHQLRTLFWVPLKKNPSTTAKTIIPDFFPFINSINKLPLIRPPALRPPASYGHFFGSPLKKKPSTMAKIGHFPTKLSDLSVNQTKLSDLFVNMCKVKFAKR